MECSKRVPDHHNYPTGPSKEQLTRTKLGAFMSMMVSIAQSEPGIRIHQGRRYSCAEEFVLAHGRTFRQPQTVQAWRNPFQEALFVAMEDMRAIYCEGFAITKDMPIPHLSAWVLQDDRLLVPGQGEYIGIPIETIYACAKYLETRSMGILVSDEKARKPILDCGLPRSAIAQIHSNRKS